MLTPRSRLVALLAAATLLTGSLAAGELAASAAPRTPPPWAADASGQVRVDRDGTGRVTFLGTPQGATITNPDVRADASAQFAARTHLRSYGAPFGVDVADLTVARSREVLGRDVVTFTQHVDGVPVLGGEVAVTLEDGQALNSMLSSTSTLAGVAPVQVSEATAHAMAAEIAARHDVTGVVDEGRWVFDPAVFGLGGDQRARSVWSFEIGDGHGVRRQVLVDDQSGAVVADFDQIETINRIVCDAANTTSSTFPLCTSGAARTEGGSASAVADVNQAYALSGATSEVYATVGLDVTDAIGIDVGGSKALASTVRFCLTGYACPLQNAFWSGQQMYYGAGYAAADDVVGHEMTHGVIDQYSSLYYWGQSGAINESIADIMGEIVDHRTVSTGDSPTDWQLGEDLPIGAIRDMANPPAKNQPDRMTSALYTLDAGYGDNGGVHTNSGVGNKTFYLLSQGGTFNGQTIAGIDVGDATLAKSTRLWFAAIASLTSGSDYADLANVLEQRCADLASVGTDGFTSTDCQAVAKAGLATQLRTTPTNAAQPADAPFACPAGSTLRVLLDSEAGATSSTFTAGTQWKRAPDATTAGNATSGTDSWFGNMPGSTTTSSLQLPSVTLPAGQTSYLWFQHWRVLHFSGSTYFDGGTVEVDDTGDAAPAVSASGLPWVNGPTQTLQTPNAGVKAFGGDSRGFVASRVDLSSYAGAAIRPQFAVRTDSSVASVGWYLDDVRVYTCDGSTIEPTPTPTPTGTPTAGPTSSPSITPPAPEPPGSPVRVRARGRLGEALVTWQASANGAAASYRVSGGGSTVVVNGLTLRAKLPLSIRGRATIEVVAVSSEGLRSAASKVTIRSTAVSIKRSRASGAAKLAGALKAGTQGLKGRPLKIQMKIGGRYKTLLKTTTKRGGKYAVRVPSTWKYRVLFPGTFGQLGSISKTR